MMGWLVSGGIAVLLLWLLASYNGLVAMNQRQPLPEIVEQRGPWGRHPASP